MLWRGQKAHKGRWESQAFCFLALVILFRSFEYRTEKPEHSTLPGILVFINIWVRFFLHTSFHLRHAARGATRAVKDIYLALDDYYPLGSVVAMSLPLLFAYFVSCFSLSFPLYM